MQLSLQIVDLEDSANKKSATTDKYTKHGLRIAPFAGETINKKQILFIYFEIYGLQKSENGLTRYELQYTLKSIGRKRGAWGKIFGIFGGKKEQLSVTDIKEGRSQDEIEHLGIDLSKQPDGKFSLEVTVRDLNNDKTAHTSVPVTLK